MEQPLSMTRLGPATLPGASNYWLSVLSSKGDSQEALRLWMLDSEPVKCARLRRMGRGCCERSTPHWLYKVSLCRVELVTSTNESAPTLMYAEKLSCLVHLLWRHVMLAWVT